MLTAAILRVPTGHKRSNVVADSLLQGCAGHDEDLNSSARASCEMLEEGGTGNRRYIVCIFISLRVQKPQLVSLDLQVYRLSSAGTQDEDWKPSKAS
ncbi:hypothetical protein NDU88_004867 [Pleurodeles waltl]|uniref:Uncharacterized protein n=1 Tax=Pleurodeles waltl TaxID=8319 RepID=A0AAV7UKG4_PLEWA|nr:hypothetical protein NDU88_004867 [Pleurodeles waltl]